jgi:hypothetical protein
MRADVLEKLVCVRVTPSTPRPRTLPVRLRAHVVRSLLNADRIPSTRRKRYPLTPLNKPDGRPRTPVPEGGAGRAGAPPQLPVPIRANRLLGKDQARLRPPIQPRDSRRLPDTPRRWNAARRRWNNATCVALPRRPRRASSRTPARGRETGTAWTCSGPSRCPTPSDGRLDHRESAASVRSRRVRIRPPEKAGFKARGDELLRTGKAQPHRLDRRRPVGFSITARGGLRASGWRRRPERGCAGKRQWFAPPFALDRRARRRRHDA